MIRLDNRLAGVKRIFHAQGRIAAFVRELARGKDPPSEPIYLAEDCGNQSVEVAMLFTEAMEEVFTFTSNTRGRTHLTGPEPPSPRSSTTTP